MAIAFNTFYPRFGKLAELCIHTNTYRGTTLPADVVDIASTYTANPDLLEGLYAQETSQQTAAGQILNYARSLAQDTLFSIVDADRPLTTRSIGAYLTELIRQQVTAGIVLDDSPASVGAVALGANNIGDAKIVISNKDVHGVTLDTVLPETLRFDVITDESRGATKWQEIVQVSGVARVSDKLDPTWPGGSGTGFTFTLRDPALDDIITNASFDSFTGHIPDDWTAVYGVAETNIEFSTTPPRSEQTYCLKLIGGGVPISLAQQVTLQPNTRYGVTIAIDVFTYDDATPLTVTLHDGSDVATANLILDDAGTSNTLSCVPVSNAKSAVSVTASSTTNLITLASHGLVSGDVVTFGGSPAPTPLSTSTNYYVRDVLANTFAVAATRGGAAIDLSDNGTSVTVSHVESWRTYTGTFITPTTLPDETWVTLTQSDTDNVLLVADVQLKPMVELYSGGPAVIGFSETIASSIVDRYTSTITVSGTNGSVVRWMERFYDVSSYSLSLPTTSGSATSGYSDATLISP